MTAETEERKGGVVGQGTEIGGGLFKRETEHLRLRQLMHGIGRDPFARA